MEKWPETTPISKVANNLDNLSPYEKYRVHIALEQSLILNLGLLKRLTTERIRKLDVSEQAKLQLETLNKPDKGMASTSSRCPFMYNQFLQKKVTVGPPASMEDPQVNDEKNTGEEDSDSDSEDSLDEYLKQWGVSFPKVKSERGSCPFIFQRMMIERKKSLEAQNIEKRNADQEDSEGIEELKGLNDEEKPAAMEKCPHIAAKMTKHALTKPEQEKETKLQWDPLSPELKKED